MEVKEGVAHLSGTFASQEEKDAAIANFKECKRSKRCNGYGYYRLLLVETVSAVAPEVPTKSY